MSRLAPDLFKRRYDELVQIGRSRLPSYAPAWTDHNAHDPGITLIELLAWVAEAQLYSLGRSRRDERQAYSALMGVEPHGARAARGLIWPDHDDPASPAAKVSQGIVIDPDWAIRLEKSDTPGFHAVHRQLWIPSRIEELKSRLADGTESDHLAANVRGGPAFQPFGADEGRDAILRMRLVATGHTPLFEAGRAKDDARLVIGIRVDTRGSQPISGSSARRASPVDVTLTASGVRTRLPVKEDTSEGMLRTGALVLDISEVEGAPMDATLEFRAPGGFERAPRLLRIEPNVIPIIQRNRATTEHLADGLPDQGFDLETPGIEFEPGSDPVELEVWDDRGPEKWTRTDKLEDCGPGDQAFTLDPAAAHIAFGNGVNGAAPAARSRILASYWVNDGQAGNIAANRKWVVPGFGGLFGVNPDPTSGGEDASDWKGQRSDARRLIRESHALVSPGDFEKAALDLPGLEVGRAKMMAPSGADLTTGTMRLIVMRTRPEKTEGGAIPESARWLASVRQRLAPRVPLGSRLQVVGPKYVAFTISAAVEAEPTKEPDDVRRKIEAELNTRLTLVSDEPGTKQRPFGLRVDRRDLAAWIQKLPDVRMVRELSIRIEGRGAVDRVDVPKGGLPQIDLGNSSLTIVRSGEGAGS